MRRLPAEFEPQSFIQIIFPHPNSDWSAYLEESEANFIEIINTITTFEDCLVICHDLDYVKSKLKPSPNLHCVYAPTNDTWARDCSAITVYEDEKAKLLDFEFTAWGGKFEARLDNALTKNLSFAYDAPIDKIDFILEGGAIESNGKGTLLTTKACLFNPNRNTLDQETSLKVLQEKLGVTKILCLENGYLEGDDTDSHIDTLARFCDANTIAYLQCEDKEDAHYEALKKMEDELKTFKDQDNKPFKLVPLPFTKAKFDEQKRLPATYANFLILNKAVLVPVYNDENDEIALSRLQKLFSLREIIPINCSTLIRQHGSLHCVSMQFPSKVNLQS